jgi:hypothetical protein
MLTTKLKLSLALAALAVAPAQAQTSTNTSTTNAPVPATAVSAAPAKPQLTGYDKWEMETKNPVPWFNWGADLRLRNEYGNNLITLNDQAARHEQDYFRIRERIWASALPATNLSVNARLSAEQREWMEPSYASQYGNRSGFEERYGIIDNLYTKWSNIGGIPLSFSIGRQDVQFGDTLNWWLVGDGTPDDGSWTFFMDSARLNYEAKEIKTKFDVVGICQSARPDAWMPTFGSAQSDTTTPYTLTEQNEVGAILYFSTKAIERAQVDGYFIYKHDNKELSYGDNADIYTLGTKISGTPSEHWAYSLEGAYQFGSKQDSTVGAAYRNSVNAWRRIAAYGANSKLTYLCKDDLNNQFSFVFECLSGDDPNTKGKDEMFDILWGRWPRWSELYIYSYVMETSRKIAQMNNVARFGPSWTITPIKDTTFSLTYNAMFALEETPTREQNASLFSHNGNFRGNYLQSVLKHKFNDHVSGHLWTEFVWMGDYYTHNDLMTFLRAELLFTF